MSTIEIRKYLEANRGKYPPEFLVAELRKAGHVENDIQEALRSLNITGVALAPVQGAITTRGKVWRFTLGFLAGGIISSVLFVASAIAISFAAAYVTGLLFNSIVVALFFYAGIIALITLAIPMRLFFHFRSRATLLARGILFGSILAAAGLFGVVFYGVIFWGWLW